jgi:uncharacterized membrane protein
MAENTDVDLSPRAQRKLDPDRVLTFTDGVFAIVITILVLDLKVPDLGSGQSLADSLEEMRPTFVSFVISFLIVGMYWAWHRSTFAQVRYIDTSVLWINLLYLLAVSLIPFAASVLGDYPDEAAALHLYGVVLIAATLVRILLFWYLGRHATLLWQDSTEKSRRLGFSLAAAPLVVYVVAMLVADALPTLSLVLYFAVPLLYLGLVAVLQTAPRTKAAAEDVS